MRIGSAGTQYSAVEMNERAEGTFTASCDGVVEGRLELMRGGTSITIRGAEIEGLCRASFRGAAPRTGVRGGRVLIDYPRVSVGEQLRSPSPRAEIALTTALPWSVVCRGSLGDSRVDLRGLDLRDFKLVGGAGDLRLVLPAPYGRVRVLLGGGATNVTLLHPEGVAVTLRIGGGASRLTFEGKRFGALGGETRFETLSAGDAAHRYEIEITGGASDLTVANDRCAGELT